MFLLFLNKGEVSSVVPIKNTLLVQEKLIILFRSKIEAKNLQVMLSWKVIAMK